MPSISDRHPKRSLSVETTSSQGSGASLGTTHSAASGNLTPLSGSTNSSTSSFSQLSLSDTRSSASSLTIADHAVSVLHAQNSLRLYGFDEAAERATKNAIMSASTHHDIQHETRLGDHGLEFKFKKRMWQNSCRLTGRRCPGTEAQMFICKLMENLEEVGWQPIVVSDVGHTDSEGDAIFYRRAPSHQTKYFACQFDEGDRLRVTAAPSDIYQGFRHIFGSHKFKEEKGDGTSLFKLHGYPLLCDHESGHKARQIFLVILDMFTAAGWELMASVNLSGEGRNSHARTWLVRKQPQLS